MKKEIKILEGANMDIDLLADGSAPWEQMKCPWNEEEGNKSHKCAVKNVSICPCFCGVEYLDKIRCSYPDKNKEETNK